MSEQGIVLQVEDERIRQRATQHHLPVKVQAGYDLPWERTLFLDAQVGRLPWDLLARGFDFLGQWEAAAPIWSYETLASHVATGVEREQAEALIGDLRVPLYEMGLLFVRRCENSERLLKLWCEEGGNDRLTFVRALYQVKPMFLALPRSWLTASARATTAPRRVVGDHMLPSGLVRVKVGPARYVRCLPGEEDEVRERYAERKARR